MFSTAIHHWPPRVSSGLERDYASSKDVYGLCTPRAMISKSVHYLAVDKCFIVVPLFAAARDCTFLSIASARYRLDLYDSSRYHCEFSYRIISRRLWIRMLTIKQPPLERAYIWNNYYSPIQFAMPININVASNSHNKSPRNKLTLIIWPNSAWRTRWPSILPAYRIGLKGRNRN